MILMTTKEAADYMRVSPMTMYRWMKNGSIPCLKVGGMWRVIYDKIDDKFSAVAEKTATQQRRH
jgi:excisionase family DNA binding protein